MSDIAYLKQRVVELEQRLQIDPGGSDKIDEFEQAMEFLRFDLQAEKARADKAEKLLDQESYSLGQMNIEATRERIRANKAELIIDVLRGVIKVEEAKVTELVGALDLLRQLGDRLRYKAPEQLNGTAIAQHMFHIADQALKEATRNTKTD